MRAWILACPLGLMTACGSSTPPAEPPRTDSPTLVQVTAPERPPSTATMVEEPGPEDTTAPPTNPAPSTAPPSPSAAVGAEAAFQDARTLMQAGRFAEACPKFEESMRLDPAIGTLLNLARCYESMGDVPAACQRYAQAEALANAEGQTARAGFAQRSRANLRCSP